MSLSSEQISALRAAHSPQQHGGHSEGWPLIIEFYLKPRSRLAPIQGPAFLIDDFSGYLTATDDLETLAECLRLETLGGAGTLRELITGKIPWRIARHIDVELTLEDLDL